MASHAITLSSIKTDDVRTPVEQKDGKFPDIAGNPDIFQLLCHASSACIMKSIHGMNRPTGDLVSVTTRELGRNGHIGMGEALTSVPDLKGIIEHDQQHNPVSAACITVNSSYRRMDFVIRRTRTRWHSNTTTSTLKLSKKGRTMR